MNFSLRLCPPKKPSLIAYWYITFRQRVVFTFSDDCPTAISLACPKRQSTTHLHSTYEGFETASCFALKSSLSCHLCPKICQMCGLHTTHHLIQSTALDEEYYLHFSQHRHYRQVVVGAPREIFLLVPQGFPWCRASGAPASNRLAGAGPDGELKGTPSNETEEELKGLVVETRRRVR